MSPADHSSPEWESRIAVAPQSTQLMLVSSSTDTGYAAEPLISSCRGSRFPETAVIARVAVFLGGVILAGWTVLSALRTVVLPRSAQSILTQGVFRGIRAAFGLVARIRSSFYWRDRVMALFAPVGLMGLAVAWLVLVAAAFMLCFWAVQQQGWAEAFKASGYSLTTLGFAGLSGVGLIALAAGEAILGLGLLALLISYLPALYAAFSRRETLVAMLEVRAGSPPSAVEMLARFHEIGMMDGLSGMWAAWEVWFADVEESHTSLPALAFFRSPEPDRHWVTAAGTILDSAALAKAAIGIGVQPQAVLLLDAGHLALRRIADVLGVDSSQPSPEWPISITRAEFDTACDRLAGVGLPMRADREAAWKEYATLRVSYDWVLLDLAELTMAPYAPWSADRSTPRHRRPRTGRWGRATRLSARGRSASPASTRQS
jgi:hypothetical protein